MPNINSLAFGGTEETQLLEDRGRFWPRNAVNRTGKPVAGILGVTDHQPQTIAVFYTAAIYAPELLPCGLTPTFSCRASYRMRARSASFNTSPVSCNVR